MKRKPNQLMCISRLSARTQASGLRTRRTASLRRNLCLEPLEPRTLLAADAFEPDGLFSQAASIATDGTPQTHSIHELADTDWMKFTLKSSTEVEIQTGGPASDPVMYLYTSEDTKSALAKDNDSGPDAHAYIKQSLPAGTYFVKVADDGNNDTIPSYSVTVTARPLDRYEPDDSAATAKSIPTDGSPQWHSVHRLKNNSLRVIGDEDWVKFTLQSSTEVEIQTGGPASDPVMYLYTSEDTKSALAKDNDSGPDAHAYIKQSLPAGTYFVKVADDGNNDTIPSYSVTVTARPLDRYEPDDSAATAKSIPTDGSPQWHSVHRLKNNSLRVIGDEDWVKFTLQSSTEVEIQTGGPASDPVMYLYTSEDTKSALAKDNDSGPDAHAYIKQSLPAGTYFVKVADDGNNDTIPSYSVTVTARPLDRYEPDDSAATAKSIPTDGSPQWHSVHRLKNNSLRVIGDEDWVKFTLQSSTEVEIQTGGPASDPVMYLYTSEDTKSALAKDNDSGPDAHACIKQSLPAGTYFVKVADDGNNDTIPSYSVTVTARPLDRYEPDDSAATAKSIPTDGSPQWHSVHRLKNDSLRVIGDEDWVKFTLTESREVEIKTGGPESDPESDPKLFLYRSTNTHSDIARDDDSGPGKHAYMRRWLDAGSYLVRIVNDDAKNTIPSYSISVYVRWVLGSGPSESRWREIILEDLTCHETEDLTARDSWG